MKKKRLIPILLLRNGWLVQSKEFSRYQNLGNPVSSVKRFSEWASDEVIYLNISKDDIYDRRREDQGYSNRHSFLEIINDVARVTFMPITVGGRIRSLNDISLLLGAGADKISINSIALQDSSFIGQAANEFGSQCIVVSIDVKIINGKYKVMAKGGSENTGYDPIEWARRAEAEGAGEILLNSIDRDGTKEGYDLKLLSTVSESVRLPIIACGGVGNWLHFAEALEKTKVDAVAAANIFQYTDQSVYLARKYLYDQGFNIRPPDLLSL